MTMLQDGRLLLIGGRMSPMRLCSQVVAIETTVHRRSEIANARQNSNFENICDCLKSNELTKPPNKSESNLSDDKENSYNEIRHLCNKCSESTGSVPRPNVSALNADESEEICDTTSCDKNVSEGGKVNSEGLKKTVVGDQFWVDVKCSEVEGITGQGPCPRWRHTTLLWTTNGSVRILHKHSV